MICFNVDNNKFRCKKRHLLEKRDEYINTLSTSVQIDTIDRMQRPPGKALFQGEILEG